MERRTFLGGAVTGAALARGAQVARARDEPAPVPAPGPAAPALPEHARLSFAQQGEDLLLYHAAHDLLKLDRPSYLDVGAAYPVKGNNTYLLYSAGARGVLVEPNPILAAELRTVRPGDIVIEAGIGVTAQTSADYYEIKGNPMLNTFSAEQVAALEKARGEPVVERVVKMPLININDAIARHMEHAPDILSTDVEGLDYEILVSLALDQFRPGIICCETLLQMPSGRPSPITHYLSARGYVPRGGSMFNTIFVDRRRIL
jgi:FkbM family methyltransferase